MKKLSSSFFVCVVLSLITLTINTYAANRPGALTFSLGAGEDYFSSKRNLKNNGIGYVALGYDITQHWGIEGMVAGFNGKFKTWVHDKRQVHGLIFAFDGLYFFSPFQFVQPYILAGAGAINLNPSRYDSNNNGNINAGVGAQLFLDKSIAFRLDARDFYTIVGGKNDVMASAGFSFLFDIA